MGSGVIISKDGYILTNNHVISEGREYYAELANGTVLQAELINADSFSDLAVLKVEGEVPAVAKLGNSDLAVSRICMGCIGFGDAGRGQHAAMKKPADKYHAAIAQIPVA